MTKKILIVEDERDLIKLLKYNLEKEGFRVNSISDGSLAIAEMRRDEPDLFMSTSAVSGRRSNMNPRSRFMFRRCMASVIDLLRPPIKTFAGLSATMSRLCNFLGL